MGTKSNMMVEFLDAKLLIRGNVFVVLYGVGAMCQKSLDLIGRILHWHRVTSEKSNPLINARLPRETNCVFLFKSALICPSTNYKTTINASFLKVSFPPVATGQLHSTVTLATFNFSNKRRKWEKMRVLLHFFPAEDELLHNFIAYKHNQSLYEQAPFVYEAC